MNWEFERGAIPDLRGTIQEFVIVHENLRGRQLVGTAFYTNRHRVEMDDCNCNDHDGNTGECRLTGWYWVSAHPDYDEYYEQVNNKVLGYVAIPTLEQALESINGGPW